MSDSYLKEDSLTSSNPGKVFMDSEAIDSLNLELQQKTKELEDLYKDMNLKLKVLDGTNATWKGKAQEAFYDHYTRVSAHFPDIIDQLNAYVLFLAETTDTYNNREKDIDTDIDNNEDKIDVN